MTEPTPTPTPPPDPSPAPSPEKRRRSSCLGRLAATVISFLIALGLAEIAVRVFGDEVLPNPIGPRYLYINDDAMGIALSPGFSGRFSLYDEFDVSIKISSQGFRDREFSAKKSGTTRIISLSDSFGFGFGVAGEDTYAKILEKSLNKGEEANRKYEVLNTGASGIGILEMIETLKRSGKWFAPDIVVASFFYGNDLQDIESFPQHTVRGGIVLTPHFGKMVDESSWLQFCFNRSNLALLVERAKFNRTTGANLGSIAKPGEAGWDVRPILLRPDPKKPEEVKWFEHQEKLWPPFEKHLATLKVETEKLGAKLVLFAIPQEFQTRDDAWEKMKSAAARSEDDYDRFLIGKKLTAICNRTDVMFLDLVPGFRATPPSKPRYFNLNKHFNEEGNAFAAKLIEDFLRQRGLL
jgi:hypothetical protein